MEKEKNGDCIDAKKKTLTVRWRSFLVSLRHRQENIEIAMDVFLPLS